MLGLVTHTDVDNQFDSIRVDSHLRHLPEVDHDMVAALVAAVDDVGEVNVAAVADDVQSVAAAAAAERADVAAAAAVGNC